MKSKKIIAGMPYTDNKHYYRIMEVVRDAGFALSHIGNCGHESIYISRGVDAAIFLKEISSEEVLEDVHQFLNGNYGKADPECNVSGRETGIYESSIGKEANDGALIIKHVSERVIIHFSFET